MRLPRVLRVLKPVVAKQVELLFLVYYSMTAKLRRTRHETGRILIARTDGLGDFIIWLSCAKEYRKLYPNKKICLMLESTKPTIELAKNMPELFDEVFNIDIHNYTRFFDIRKMGRLEFDTVLQPVYTRVSFTDILCFACKAKERITLDTNAKFLTPLQLWLSNQGYDTIIPVTPGVQHEIVRGADMIRGLGTPEYLSGLPSLAAKSVAEKESSFISFPSASSPTKIWEKEKYAEILDAIVQQTGWRCLLSGGREDIELLEKIRDLMVKKDFVTVIAGQTSLPETVEILHRMQFAIGNDTGAMHMAVACGVPSVVLMGDSEIGRFFPYKSENGEAAKLAVADADMPCKGCSAEKDTPCRYPCGEAGTYRCISEITTDRCLRAISQVIGAVS